jgi:hypothetical protein
LTPSTGSTFRTPVTPARTIRGQRFASTARPPSLGSETVRSANWTSTPPTTGSSAAVRYSRTVARTPS